VPITSPRAAVPLASLGLALVVTALPAPARAAETTATASAPSAPSAPTHLLIADLGQHVVGVGYQRTISPWVGAQIALDYYQPWTQNIDFLGLSGAANKGGDLRGAVTRVRVFFHPFGGAPTGLWISPFAQAGVGWGVRDGERRAGPVSAAGASVGYSALLGSSVLLGGGLGGQYHAAKIAGDGPPSFSRFYPQVDIQLGFVL
jgi:hypothetical protein